MRGWWTTSSSLRAAGTNRNTTWKRGKEHLVWQAGRLKTYQNTIIDLFSAIMKKNGKSFGRLQAPALLQSKTLTKTQLANLSTKYPKDCLLEQNLHLGGLGKT